jgi:hypothetical protein
MELCGIRVARYTTATCVSLLRFWPTLQQSTHLCIGACVWINDKQVKFKWQIQCQVKSRILTPKSGDDESVCFWLAQCVLRCGQTPFCSLCGYRLAVDYFRMENGVTRESYPSICCKLGGGHILGLCFWFSLREVVFKLVCRPVGKTAAVIPRGATQTPGYVKELKLVWGI